jgi:hypothetical protein
MRKKIIYVFVGLLVGFTQAYSQGESKPVSPILLTYQSTMIGIGETRAYDSYLSPLKYEGANLGLIYEEMRRMTSVGENIFSQHFFTLDFAKTKNPTKSANDYVGNIEYAYGLYQRFEPLPKLHLHGGLQADALIGFIYNDRNGNNPASLKTAFNLNLSGIAGYQFQIKKQSFLLRYQLNIPFAGLVFSPEYGQSYYEISMDEGAEIIYPASFHNQLAMRNLFSVELPFPSCTLHLAYMNWIYETKINSLDTHILSNSFYVGFSKNFFTVSGRRQNKNNYRNVFE